MRSLVASAERVGVADTTAAGAVDQLRSAIALQPEDGKLTMLEDTAVPGV